VAVTDYASQGSRSVKVVTSSVSGRNVLGGSVTNGTIPVDAGQTYTFMVDAKQTAGTAATAKATIYWWTSAGNVAASTAISSGAVGTLSSSWQTFTDRCRTRRRRVRRCCYCATAQAKR
jgi:hypothetical protein